MSKGFTLIELLLVISIFLIIGTSSGVFYSRFINQNSVSIVSDQITEMLHKAQVYAMMGKNNSDWGVTLSGTTLTLFSSTTSALNETFSFSQAMTVTGLSTITFSRGTGIPTTTPTITISGGGNSKSLVMNAQGVVNR